MALLTDHAALETQCIPFTLQWAQLDAQLLQQYGGRLAEIPMDTLDQIEYLVPRLPECALPLGLRRARVQRWSAVGCTVLTYLGGRFITTPEMDAAHRTFLYWLCMACDPKSNHRFIFVDADTSQQHTLFMDIKNDSQWDHTIWLADNIETAINVSDLLGGMHVDTVSSFVRKDNSPTVFDSVRCDDSVTIAEHCAVIVVGMHRLSLSQQTSLFHTIVTTILPVRGVQLTVFLAGNALLRSLGPDGLDPWSCCCLAETSKSGILGGQKARQAVASLSIWSQQIASRFPLLPTPVSLAEIATSPAGWRWLVVPHDSRRRIAQWFTNNVDCLQANAIVLTSSQNDQMIMASSAFGPNTTSLPPLRDRTCPAIGQCIRCVRETLTLTFGAVYCITGFDNVQAQVHLQLSDGVPGIVLVVPVGDVQASCETAYIGLLQHTTNCYFGMRPVYVLLVDATIQPRLWQYNPFLLTHQLGTNVTLVATTDCMKSASERLQLAMSTEKYKLPFSMWQGLVDFLTKKYAEDRWE